MVDVLPGSADGLRYVTDQVAQALAAAAPQPAGGLNVSQ